MIMATIALLCSEKFVKGISSISDNLEGKVLTTAIREAQDIRLRGILGDALLEKLVSLVQNETMESPENVHYKKLADKCQYILAYAAIGDVLVKVNYKIGNFGVATSSDENLTPVNFEDLCHVRDEYVKKADTYCRLLQDYLHANRSLYPELTENGCGATGPNLNSSATTGIWLGGARGKIIR